MTADNIAPYRLWCQIEFIKFMNIIIAIICISLSGLRHQNSGASCSDRAVGMISEIVLFFDFEKQLDKRNQLFRIACVRAKVNQAICYELRNFLLDLFLSHSKHTFSYAITMQQKAIPSGTF